MHGVAHGLLDFGGAYYGSAHGCGDWSGAFHGLNDGPDGLRRSPDGSVYDSDDPYGIGLGSVNGFVGPYCSVHGSFPAPYASFS